MRSLIKLNGLAAAILVTTLFADVARAQEARSLRWRWEPGQTLLYKLGQTSDQTMDIPGQGEMETSSEMEMLMRQTVDDVSDEGIATVTMTYERVKFKLENPFMNVDWDSQRPDEELEENPMIGPLTAFAGKSVTFSVDLSGEVQAVEGASQIMESMFDQMKDDPMMGQIMDQLKEALGDDSMKTMLNMMMDVLPEKDVTRGDKWESEYEQALPMVGTMTGKQFYTLTDFATVWGHEAVRIQMEGSMEVIPPAEGEGGLPEGMSLNFDDTKMSGEIIFAFDVGYILRSSTKTEMKNTITVKAGERDMTMKQETVQEMVYELVEERR